MKRNTLKLYKRIFTILWEELQLLLLLPPGLVLILVFVTDSSFLGIKFDFKPVTIPLNIAIFFSLVFLLYRVTRTLSLHYYGYPILFESWEINRVYSVRLNEIGLHCEETETVCAKILDHSVVSIKHVTKRVENDCLAFDHRSTACTVKKIGNEDTSIVKFEKSQITNSEMVHRLKFPHQKVNTVIEYIIKSQYGGAQFKSQKEIQTANQNGLKRINCVSGKHIVRPTKSFLLKLVFPSDYRVVPRVCVCNTDGELKDLEDNLQRNLLTEIDHNNQLKVTLKVDSPLVGLSYQILWDPPDL